jgi:hypothetical protein
MAQGLIDTAVISIIMFYGTDIFMEEGWVNDTTLLG